MQAFVISGAEVILDDRVERCEVRFEGDRITGIDVARDGAEVIEAKGKILAPAMIDIHGDAFERQLMPRPNVFFPLEAALLETDRQLGANGIGTAYHALTLSWEPGLRSVETGQEVIGMLNRLAPRLTVENRVQLRWETFCFEAISLIEAAIAGPLAPSVAFNDHTSMALLDPSVPLQTRPFDLAPDYPLTDLGGEDFRAKMEARAKRGNVDADHYIRQITEIWQRRPEVPGAIAQVADMGRKAGLSMLSHDDSQIEARDHYRDLGARISEFPMNRTVAEAAREAGDWIVLGAPNAMRGGSHLGSLGAGEMIAAGLCDILASDYYYPAMLAAVERLRRDGIGDLARLWKLVSGNPAAASGLTDRGEIAAGKRADLVLLDWPEGHAPAPRATWVAGRTAYAAAA